MKHIFLLFITNMSGHYKMYDVLHGLRFFFLLFGLDESCDKVLWQMWHQAFVYSEIDL